MEQTTLYRKYRPIDFDTVVGQDAIVRTLKNQIAKNKISHAYLFCGTRGTGKTTVAKIFARAVNCEHKRDSNPCNQCEICCNILDGKDLNVYELDAAANNGVDDIRNIKSLTEYPPSNNEKYKVFIIDEAHELSDKARDAFLKTLEEPPSYVIFILCTTEPNKFKQTILSRCQRYDFKRISVNDIQKYLRTICEKENIKIDDDALYFIALHADGSMRESISLLDRVRSFEENNISLKITEDILGVADEKYFNDLTVCIIKEDVVGSINIINKLINEGKEISQFLNDYIWYLRNVLLIKNLDKENDILSITKEKFEELKTLRNQIGTNTLIWYINKLSETANILKQDENKRVILETCFIRLCMMQNDNSNDGLLSRIDVLEKKVSNVSYQKVFDISNDEICNNIKEQNNINESIDKEKDFNIKPEKENNQNDIVTDDIFDLVKKSWKEIISIFDRQQLTLLKKIELIKNENGNIINLNTGSIIAYKSLNKEEILQKLSMQTEKITNHHIEYVLNNFVKKDLFKEKNMLIDMKLEKMGIPIIEIED